MASLISEPVRKEPGGVGRAFSWDGSGIAVSLLLSQWLACSHVVLPPCKGVWHVRASCEPRREPRFARFGEPSRVCRRGFWEKLSLAQPVEDGWKWGAVSLGKGRECPAHFGGTRCPGGGRGGRECRRPYDVSLPSSPPPIPDSLTVGVCFQPRHHLCPQAGPSQGKCYLIQSFYLCSFGAGGQLRLWEMK